MEWQSTGRTTEREGEKGATRMMVCCTAAGELLQAAAYVELLRCCWPAVALLACCPPVLYIEFYDVMSVPMAIALSGQFLLGQPVMVKPSEAEKNLVRLSLSSCLLMKVGTAKFACLEGARNAWSLNGQSEIGGRTIKVSAITDQSGMQEVGGNIGDLDDD
ncbi:RNA-binding protein [Arachis hypogaea]|uniref:RNA-binding protein n=1 Tax=Arachis hypogaea TaxID=3818 RepID=A0A6B9VGJ0_ARAHY|nr:RNA-binding protein [Arachis hypogaea]